MRRSELLASAVLAASLLATGPVRAAQEGPSGERGLISADLVDLRAEPKDKAKSRVKLSHGTLIAATDHTPDGQWVKVVADVEKGPDTIHFEGWIQKKYVRSISRYGFSWERHDGGGGGGGGGGGAKSDGGGGGGGGGDWDGGGGGSGGGAATAASGGGGGGDDWGGGG